MAKKIWLFVVMMLVIFAQDDDDFEVVDSDNQNYQQEQQYDQRAFGNPDVQGMSQQDQQRYFGMRRTACLILSRYHSNSQKDEVEPILKGLPVQKQQNYINKMYTTAIIMCQNAITPEEVQMLFVENKDFHPEILFYLFERLNYREIQNNLKFSAGEKEILKYIKQFDEEMEVKREQQRAEEQKMDQQEQQVKIFWYSLSDFGKGAQVIYITIVVVIIIGVSWWVLGQVNNSTGQKVQKKKKKPKKNE